jgi:general nucleoside transport system permease protein
MSTIETSLREGAHFLPDWLERHPRAGTAARWLSWALVGVLAYSSLVLIYGKSPIDAFQHIWSNTLTTEYGLLDVLVRMTPLLLTAMAVAIPARLIQVNVGGEGQLYIGGLTATGVAITFTSWPAWLLLPAMALAGMAGGGVWAGIAGWLKARGWLSEVFSTVLMNYIAILAVSALVFGPWRDPTSSNYPQSTEFVPAARLPHLGDTRVDITIIVAFGAVFVFDWFLRRTRFGLEVRAIGGNPYAAQANGVPVARYIIAAMFIGGAFAGLAGMAQASALQLHLNPGLSAGFGYLGFLISWLAGHNPRLIVPMTFLLAVLASSGDILQITQGLPAATVNVLSAVLMMVVLLGRMQKRPT